MSDQIDLFGGEQTNGTASQGDRLDDRTSIGKARLWLFERYKKGVDCPCCGQTVRLYPRPITSAMAFGLMIVGKYQEATGEEWAYLPRVIPNVTINSPFCMLQHWELIRPRPGERPDGSHRNGWWSITESGREYIDPAIALKVPRWALVYNSRCEGFRGDHLSIQEALGTKYDHAAMMDLPIDALQVTLLNIEKERREKKNAKGKTREGDE